MLKLSAVEQRIFDLLGDGKGHSKQELVALLQDPAADDNMLHCAIYRLRLKLYAIDEDLVAQATGRRIRYRRVRMLHPSPNNRQV